MPPDRASPSSRSWTRSGPSPLRSHTTSCPSQEAIAPLHIQHLRDVASWASSAVPPLGAFLGFRLGSSCETLGLPLPRSNCFSCDRCESSLEVGANCSVRVKPWKGPRSSRSVNKIVYFCHYCSYENRKSGTQNAYVKGKLIDFTGSIGISTRETVQSTENVICCDGQTSAKVVSSGSFAKKRNRKGWLTLKELTASSNECFEAKKASLSVREIVKPTGLSSKYFRSPMAAGPLSTCVLSLSAEDGISDLAAPSTMLSRESISNDGSVPLPYNDKYEAEDNMSSDEPVPLPSNKKNEAEDNLSNDGPEPLPLNDNDEAEDNMSGQIGVVKAPGSPVISERHGVVNEGNGLCSADEGPVSIDGNEYQKNDFTDKLQKNVHGCVHQTEQENLDSSIVGSNLISIAVAADTIMSENLNDDHCPTNRQHDLGLSSDKEEDICDLQGSTDEENLKVAEISLNSDSSKFCAMVVREEIKHRETGISESQSVDFNIEASEAVKATDILVKDDVTATSNGCLQIRKQQFAKTELEDPKAMEIVNILQDVAAERKHVVDHVNSHNNKVEHVEPCNPPERENVYSDDKIIQEPSNLHTVSCARISESHGKDHANVFEGLYETMDRKENEETVALDKTRIEKEDALSLMGLNVSSPILQDKVLQSLEQVLSNANESLAIKKQHSELLIDLQQSVRRLNVGRKLQKLIASEDILEQKLSALDAKYSLIEQKLSEIPNIRNEIHCLSAKVTDIAYIVKDLREVLAESLVFKLDQTLKYTKNAFQLGEAQVDLSQALVEQLSKSGQQLESSKISNQLVEECAKGFVGGSDKQLCRFDDIPTHKNELILSRNSSDKTDSCQASLLQIEDARLHSRKRCNDDIMDDCRPSKHERHHDDTLKLDANGSNVEEISNKAAIVENRKRPVFSRIGRHWYQFYWKKGKFCWRMI